jgi:hypothetical protein
LLELEAALGFAGLVGEGAGFVPAFGDSGLAGAPDLLVGGGTVFIGVPVAVLVSSGDGGIRSLGISRSAGLGFCCSNQA